jgi:D-inositol-3-phosphate glycosyltransferase
MSGTPNLSRGLLAEQPVNSVSSDKTHAPARRVRRRSRIALLTGGADKPYALGLAAALKEKQIPIDFIGSDEINGPELHDTPLVRFLNLRGDQNPQSPAWRKLIRVLIYYVRLVWYVAGGSPGVLHILWNNKFETFDRTILMLYYRLLGKKVVFTAHNVNTAKRDGCDSWFNRFTLRFQYGLCHHIFLHTEKMRAELQRDFRVPEQKTSVIPFGINNTLPATNLTRVEARRLMGLSARDKTILFFGNIAPYKGLEYLIDAFRAISAEDSDYRLIIGGRPKGCQPYWDKIQEQIAGSGCGDRIIQRIEYIPDEKVEQFFKAADVLVLPYTEIFQSGVLFLGYSFGLPVIATDVGSLREDIVEEKTGFVAQPLNSQALATTLKTYFASPLFANLGSRGPEIKAYANERYSWAGVAEITATVYNLLDRQKC